MADVSVRKRGSKWEYYFELAKVDGKRKRKTKGGFKTKTEALKAGAIAYAEYMNTGLDFTPSDMSVNDYMDYWMENYVKVNCSEVTFRGYFKRIRLYIKPELGNYYLKQLSAASIQQLLNKLFNDGMSRNSLVGLKAILSGALNYAVEPCRFIKDSPMNYVKLPSKRAKSEAPTRSKKHIYIEPDIWSKIIERFPEGHPSHIPLMLGYHCGLRLSEAYGLMWDDIDFDNKLLTIDRQIQYNEDMKSWELCPPKYESYRTISMDEELTALLKREKERQELRKKEYGIFYTLNYIDGVRESEHLYDSGYLSDKGILADFLNVRENGTYIQSRGMMHTLRVIHGKDNGKNVEPISKEMDFHSLRHTHGTMLLEAGVPLPLIQERLGHAKIDMTEHYTNHVTNTMRESVIKTLNDLYG